MITTLTYSCEEDRIYDFLLRNSESFIPPLSTRVEVFEYARKLANKASNIFISHNGVDVGHAAIYFNVTPNAFLTSFCVDFSCQRMNLGNILMIETLKICEIQRIQKIELEVSSLNKGALKFYKKHGFLEIRENAQTIFMCKEVSPRMI